ncbi:MAG TPA: hypothetical protein VFE24_04895 [Pirellulales bacterium]|nr:hypothetical protein [Pirellulales bacterium]
MTSAGLLELSKLPKLRVLRLAGLHIDDSAFSALEQMPSLDTVTIRDGKFSKAGLQAFSAKRPRIDITDLSNLGGAIDLPR